MEHENIIFEVNEGIAVIRLNRPEKLNALQPSLWVALARALQKADMDPAAQVIVLTGEGKAFCAGDDIAVLANLERDGGHNELVFESVFGLVSAIVYLRKPFIVAVNGLAYGGGCEIALLADLVIASEQAVFAVPEARVGIFPLICTVFGPYLLGLKASNELCMLCEAISARRAQELGLVNRIAPHDQVMDTALEMARTIQKSSPLSISMIKQNASRMLAERLHDFWTICNRTVGETFNSEDFKEGSSAFTQKRQPRFVGR